MPQPVLRTARLLLVPFADRHLDLEIQLDSDPEVLRYRLVRRYWRQGLASEASRALLRHAFATVGQNRVIAQTMSVNTASRGVLQAIGMRYVRTFPSSENPVPGTELSEVEYEMTRGIGRRSANMKAPPYDVPFARPPGHEGYRRNQSGGYACVIMAAFRWCATGCRYRCAL